MTNLQPSAKRVRVVSLPWYDLPSAHRALNGFWSILRGALHAEGVERLPLELERTTPLKTQWSHPDLLLSQCCGLDLFTPAAHALSPIGRPVFSDLACEPGHYFSYIVSVSGANLSSKRPARIAINSPSSRSGCTALLGWLKARDWTPQQVRVSGSHQASANLLRRGLVDVAAIDAHSWTLLERGGLEIIGRTAEAPTPPFVSHCECDVPKAVLLRVLREGVARGGKEVRIREVMPVDREVYRSLADEAACLLGAEVAERLKISGAESMCGVACT